MNQMKTFAFIIVIIFCFVEYLLCKEGVSYKYQRCGCKAFNKKFIHNASCRVRHINRTTQSLNVEVNLQPNVSISNIRIDITSYFKFGTVFRPSLVKHSEFICEALNNKAFSHILHFLEKSYKKFTNALQPCPILGKLYAKNMIIDLTKFPQFLPIGEYRVDVKAFTYMNGYEEFILLHQDYGEVKPLGAEQF